MTDLCLFLLHSETQFKIDHRWVEFKSICEHHALVIQRKYIISLSGQSKYDEKIKKKIIRGANKGPINPPPGPPPPPKQYLICIISDCVIYNLNLRKKKYFFTGPVSLNLRLVASIHNLNSSIDGNF